MFESISSIDGEITSVLLRLPRPGLDWNEARRKNLRYYELGSDQGHNIPSGDKALLRLADELNSGLEEITPLIGPAMRVGC